MIFEPKTLHSLTMFSNWLSAVGIDNEIEENNDLTVQDVDRNPIEVRLSMDPIAEKAPAGMIILDAKAITGRDLDRAKDIFKTFVESLGFEYLDPTGRPEPSKVKIYAKNDFESVYLRHNDIRRSPNPDTNRLLFYKNVVDMVAKSVYNKNAIFWSMNQVDLDDLKSIAMTHVVSYIANYEVPDHMDKEDNNLRKCHSFLTQRLYFYKSMLQDKSKNCHTGKGNLYLFDAQDEIDKEYIERHNSFSSKDKTIRRKEAKALLQQSLETMSHNDMIDTLNTASVSSYIHPDAAKLAQKILNEHYLECGACLAQESEKESPMYVGGV